MTARIASQMFTLLILFQAGDVALSATINGSPQCDLCSLNNQLLQKVNDLNKGQSAIKGLSISVHRGGPKLQRSEMAILRVSIPWNHARFVPKQWCLHEEHLTEVCLPWSWVCKRGKQANLALSDLDGWLFRILQPPVLWRRFSCFVMRWILSAICSQTFYRSGTAF